MTRPILSAGLLLVAAACDDRAPEAAAAEEPASSAEAARPTPPDPAPGKRPPSKQTSLPAADRVGTLPAQIGVAVGERAPDATVTDADGNGVRLHDLMERGPVMLVFYRGGWCPFCNFQIRELTESHPRYRERGVLPVAISVDRTDEAAKTSAAYEIPFPVLSDPDLSAHRAYRVMHEVDDAERARLEGFGMDIEQASGRDHHVIAVPSIFVVDAAGVVRWAHADPDYRARPSDEQLLAAIDALDLSAAE